MDVRYENLFRQRALVPLSSSIDGLGLRSLLHSVGVVIDPPLCAARRPGHVMGQGVGLPDGRVPKRLKSLKESSQVSSRDCGVGGAIPFLVSLVNDRYV